MKKVKIATRKSALAMWQSEHIADLLMQKYSDLSVELVGLKTKGDVILDTPLAKIGGKGLFTKELEDSMLNRNSDLAVHSLKDVPVIFPDGLVLSAISKREDVRDSFVSDKYSSFDELPNGARVGTTSLRRRMQLLMIRPDLQIFSLRGNVNTRLKKLKDGEFDAIILAKAGINRLELEKEISFVKPFELDQMIPAMGQGALGIESINDPKILELLQFLNDEDSVLETTIEREFVATLNGGCQVPIGINAKIDGDEITIRAVVGLPDASRVIKQTKVIKRSQAANAGIDLANEFIKQGAKELLKQAEIMAMDIL